MAEIFFMYDLTQADEQYTGCVINRKVAVKKVSSSDIKWLPREEWIIVENMHEAIISKELFEQAQKILKTHHLKRPRSAPYEKYRGILRCKCCGRVLRKSHGKQVYYSCHNGRAVKDFPCADVHLGQEELEKRVLEEVKRLTGEGMENNGSEESIKEKLKGCMEESAENMDGSGEKKADRGMDEIAEKTKGVREWDNAEKVKNTGKFQKKELEMKIHKCEVEMGQLKSRQITLFENYAEGKVAKDVFLSGKTEISDQLRATEGRLFELSEQKKSMEMAAASERLLEKARAKKVVFAPETGITREMLENLVKVIWVDGENQVEVVLKE